MPDLGQRLADEMSGCKLEVTSFSSRKKMTDSQLARVASFFESDAKSVSGGREILNKKIPEVKTVYGIIRAARAHWQAYTVKYEDGVRLIKVDQIERMNEQINRYQNELAEAKQALYDAWETVKQDAQRRLAQLYVEADYRIDVRQMIWLTISYPSVQPDKKLEQLGKYFMHGTSHYLGLDVHDPGSYGPLKANSVITVEPGIYIPEGSDCELKWWNIGIRIEDDILITPNGPVNMSAKLVRTADEIEAIVGNAP
jgi:hypothetical protein